MTDEDSDSITQHKNQIEPFKEGEEEEQEEDKHYDEGENEEEGEKDDIESVNEEELLKDRLNEVEFGKLIKAKTRLEYQSKRNTIGKKPKSKQEILNKLKKTNQDKNKHEPKEYSALIKPKFQMKHQQQQKILLGKKKYRDPRFDDLSGTLNQDALDKNFSFVKEMAGEYVDKINKFKKSKKNKKKVSEDNYELLKKQTNYVKGWLNKQKQLQEKKEVHGEINKENKKRMQEGKKPIYVKDNAIKKYIKKQKEAAE